MYQDTLQSYTARQDILQSYTVRILWYYSKYRSYWNKIETQKQIHVRRNFTYDRGDIRFNDYGWGYSLDGAKD